MIQFLPTVREIVSVVFYPPTDANSGSVKYLRWAYARIVNGFKLTMRNIFAKSSIYLKDPDCTSELF